MTPCNDAQHDFSAYWEGDLPALRRERLESHWSTCEHCRTEYETFAAAMQAVQALPHLEAPADLTSRVLARVRAIEAARPAAWWSPGRLFDWEAWRADWGWRPLVAAAAAVVAVVAGVAIVQQLRGPVLEGPSGPAVAVDLPADEAPSVSLPEPSPETVETPTPAAERSLAAALPVDEASPGSESQHPESAPAGGGSLVADAGKPQPEGGTASSFLDSLLLQGTDVEYALDRIRLRNVPGDSGLTPMPAMPGAPEGKPASLTF
jgi:hypothetical protein